MAGHMGADRVTVRNLEVVEVDAEDNVLVVQGRGARRRRRLLLIRKGPAAKARGRHHGREEEGRQARQPSAGAAPTKKASPGRTSARPAAVGDVAPVGEGADRGGPRTSGRDLALPRGVRRPVNDTCSTKRSQYRPAAAAARTRPRPARRSPAAAASSGSRRAPAARASARSRCPLWRHGGTVSARSRASTAYQLPKKMRLAALRSALSQQAARTARSRSSTASRSRRPRPRMLQGHPGHAGRRRQGAAGGPRPATRNLELSGRNLPGREGGGPAGAHRTTCCTAGCCSSRRRPRALEEVLASEHEEPLRRHPAAPHHREVDRAEGRRGAPSASRCPARPPRPRSSTRSRSFSR